MLQIHQKGLAGHDTGATVDWPGERDLLASCARTGSPALHQKSLRPGGATALRLANLEFELISGRGRASK